ncbi:glycine oxidase ThiO [Wolbachia endosymbiont of Ctenocephalides felis wCfeT]|uniref:glycine oxidase ThiO n=1 Tax=Wolbachia endosymbiont of Ctenocephalides felis wCfeT TaxID=2732593 RepID=UPI0014467E79|nr:glycine oxidase ThiO [Wolbachia endosymbiont of Ctenocephalides felis wCfeT]
MRSVGIVGAGIIGRLLALNLLQNGWHVTLFDIDDQEGKASCSYAAAGMLSPLFELEKADSIIHSVGVKSINLWRSILPTLGQSVYFQNKGSLILAHAQDVNELARIKGQIEAKLYISLKVLTHDEISKLEPALSHWSSNGLYCDFGGQIDNRMLLAALRFTLLEKGIVWKSETYVQNIEPRKVISSSKAYDFDVVCDCRGLGARDLHPDLRGVRGELIYLHAPEVGIIRPIRLIHPRYCIYIAPRQNSIYVIGASEIESEELSPISVRTTLELLSAAYSIHPGFAEARVISSSVNCRPAFPDNLPRISYTEGLLSINGLYRHGFLLAPVLVEEAISVIEMGTNSILHPEILRGFSNDICKVQW